MKNRLISDIGGLPEGPLDLSEHEPTMTERRIDAMMMLLRAKPRSFWASDENRRTIESLEPETYKKAEYYEKMGISNERATYRKSYPHRGRDREQT